MQLQTCLQTESMKQYQNEEKVFSYNGTKAGNLLYMQNWIVNHPPNQQNKKTPFHHNSLEEVQKEMEKTNKQNAAYFSILHQASQIRHTEPD